MLLVVRRGGEEEERKSRVKMERTRRNRSCSATE